MSGCCSHQAGRALELQKNAAVSPSTAAFIAASLGGLSRLRDTGTMRLVDGRNQHFIFVIASEFKRLESLRSDN